MVTLFKIFSFIIGIVALFITLLLVDAFAFSGKYLVVPVREAVEQALTKNTKRIDSLEQRVKILENEHR